MKIIRRGLLWAGMLLLLTYSPAPSQGAPLRILPAGDSITLGVSVPGGYRAPLYELLRDAGYEVDFLGTLTANGAPNLPDPQHEGYGGYLIEQLDARVSTTFAAVGPADIILLLIGTNDYGQGHDTAHATNRLEALIENIVKVQPTAKIIVASLLVRSEESLNMQIQTTFNPLLPGLCARQRELGHAVYFHDLRRAMPMTELGDNVHPNATGYFHLAQSWFAAIDFLWSHDGIQVLEAEADATVADGLLADTNYGSVPTLSVGATATVRESYLRFALTNLSGRVIDAKIRLWPVTATSTATNSIALVPDNSWSERTITWNTRPSSEAAMATWSPQTGQPQEIDVRDVVQAAITNGGHISFRVFPAPGSGGSTYASREQELYYVPRLTVVISNTPPTISAFADQTIPRNGSLVLPFTIADAESPLDQLQVTATASNTNLFAAQNIEIIGVGANRMLSLIAGSNQLGSAQITVTVSDRESTAAASFRVLVDGTNNAPVLVQFTSPSGVATFAAPASISLATSVSDPDGNIARVDYFLGNAIVGSATTRPYTFVWSGIPAGTYRLRAVATDEGGLSATSSIRQVTVTLPTVTFVAAGAGWRYFDVNGVDLGTSWRERTFNDMTWAVGPARLGFGDPAMTMVDATPTRVTTYFRHSFVVPAGSIYTNLTVGLVRDDGAVVYLNGTEIFRSNMPGGTIANGTLALSAISGAEETTWFTNQMTGAGPLVAGTNVIAVEVHQGSASSSDLGFDLLLTAMVRLPTVPAIALTTQLDEASGDLVVSWPAASGWNLYATPQLGSAAVWTRISTGLAIANGQLTFRFRPTEISQFFQLRQP